jgi:predicted DNA-binding WGR domain protein
MRTFEHRDGRSHKFWTIDLQGDRFTVTFGRSGTAGQTQTKTFADETKARAAHDKLVAEKLAKGALLVFQMHYTPDGVERKDRSSVGIVFAKRPPRYEVRTRAVTQQVFLIPPGAKSHEVRSRGTFDRDVELLSLFPHMHLRGKDFQYVAVYPDGKKETLLSVPRYDFNWQTSYWTKKPIHLPANTRIECTAHFDNSSGNLNNPDPKKWVHWGEQTWEEMMIGFVDYASAIDAGKKEEKK